MLAFIRAANILGKPFGFNPFPRAFANAATDGTTSRKAAFNRIFRSNGWGSAESVSGEGSEQVRTRAYVAELRSFLDRIDARRVFDAPCGDLNWIEPAVAAREYIGGDIAEGLIEQLRQKRPDLNLLQFDICADPFPDADVWHCRDCLFHLPLVDVRSALQNFAKSRIPYALLTTHKVRGPHRNLDVPVGGFRYLDLERAPFNLPEPVEYLRDYRLGRDFPRFVGVWRREQVAEALR